MGLANRFLQHVYGRTPFLAVRELTSKSTLDIGDMVAVRALGAVAGAADLEANGFGPLDRDGVDVHRCAPGDGDKQQLDRGEFTSLLPAERQRSAAGVCRFEMMLAQPGEIDRGHAPTLADSGRLVRCSQLSDRLQLRSDRHSVSPQGEL